MDTQYSISPQMAQWCTYCALNINQAICRRRTSHRCVCHLTVIFSIKCMERLHREWSQTEENRQNTDWTCSKSD